MNRGYFSGTYLNGVDGKHRLSVPAPIRDTVEARGGERCVVLAPAEHAPCLVGYDPSHFNALRAELNERHSGDFGPARARTARQLFAMADRFRYDDTGRIVLTPVLRDLGDIGPQALFLGLGDYFELWSPAQLLAQPDLDPRMIRMVNSLMSQRAGA